MQPDAKSLMMFVSIKEAAEVLEIPHTRLRRLWDTQKDTWPKPVKTYGITPVFYMPCVLVWWEWWQKVREHD